MVLTSYECETFLIEGRLYPSVLLGGDQFLDYWGTQRFPELATVEGVYAVMVAAFQNGVRGFDLSMNEHVLEAFRKLRQETSNRAIGVANPNWKLDITLNGTRLWDIRWRIVATVLQDCLAENIDQLRTANSGIWEDWFANAQNEVPLDRKDRDSWVFDEDAYRQRMKPYKGIADFCLVGGDYADWCIALGRIDIVKRMISCARHEGFTPISVSHWTSLSLDALDQLDYGGHWVVACLDRQILFEAPMLSSIASSNKPLTAFQVLGHGRHADRIGEAFEYIRDTIGASSIVVGVCSRDHAQETFAILRQVYPALWKVVEQ